jgi:hypothetical protein
MTHGSFVLSKKKEEEKKNMIFFQEEPEEKLFPDQAKILSKSGNNQINYEYHAS